MTLLALMNDFFEILKINYYSFVDACYFVYSEFSCLASENQQDFFENSDFSDPEVKGSTLKGVIAHISSEKCRTRPQRADTYPPNSLTHHHIIHLGYKVWI